MGNRFTIAFGIGLALASVVRADQLIKTDGSTLQGKVVAEQKDSVTFETHAGGISLRQKIARSQVKEIRREIKDGPGYCPLPIIGVIGQDVLARDVEAGIREARRSKPQFVVLVIDSPGGAIDEMVKITQLVRDNSNDLKFVAFVRRQAISAAAIIALSCPKIYVAPGASIGAAVPFKIGPDGTPVAVEAKFESAIQAEMRNTARLGGHDELWVRGMTELDLALAVDTSGGDDEEAADPILCLAVEAPSGSRVIKQAGKILTLTADDAVAYGLAAGMVKETSAVKDELGIKAWHVSDDGNAWRLMEDRARSARAALDRRAEQIDYVGRAVPQLVYIDRRIAQLNRRATDIKNDALELKRQFDEEMKDLEAQRQFALRRALSGANPTSNMKQVNDDFAAKRKEIANRYLPQAQAYVDEAKSLKEEGDRLVEKRKDLIANAPTD